MTEGWRADLLDSDDNKLADLPRVKGGSLNWSIFRDIQGDGSLDITDGAVDVEPNWLSHRVQLWHTDRLGVERPFSIWLVTQPGVEVVHPGLSHLSLRLQDKTQLLNQPIGSWVTYAAGTVVTSTVSGIILSRGESRTNVQASTETLTSSVSFEPEDTWLKVVNTLLAAIGYSSVSADMYGIMGAAPYVAPGDRPLVETYAAGKAKMLPSYSDEADLSSIPNVVKIISAGDETTAGLIGSASNDDPSDPLSTANRPEVVVVENVDEATSQGAIDAIAVKRLHELMQVTRRATITHPVDKTQLNDVVKHGPAGFTGPIVQRGINLALGAVVEDTIRRIYTGDDLS